MVTHTKKVFVETGGQSGQQHVPESCTRDAPYVLNLREELLIACVPEIVLQPVRNQLLARQFCPVKCTVLKMYRVVHRKHLDILYWVKVTEKIASTKNR